MHYDFNDDFQQLLLSYWISEPNMFAVSQTIVNPDHFEPKLRPAVRFILEYAEAYKSVPTPAQIKANSGVPVDLFDGVSEQANNWFLAEVERFARHKALELAILDGVDLLEKGEGGEVERRVREAMTISLTKDLGTRYFHDPKTRLEAMKDRTNMVSTGWRVLDDKLFGGFTPGALNVFAGGSGAGKSLWLQNIALNWAFAGMNVVYFSLELSEDLVAMRLDAMVSGCSTKDVFKNVDKVAMTVRMKGTKAGEITLKKMPEAGTTTNHLRAFIKEYEIKTGNKPQAIVVDYLDLMHPNNGKINPSDLFVKDKYVSEELRGLAGELGVLFATASQLNRQSVEATEFDHSHIAGGISKINTADNVFGIFSSAPMRERGEYQLQFLKTRSSSAVGQKVTLSYDPISLRINDPDTDAGEMRSMTGEEVREELRQKTKAGANPPPTEETKGETIKSVTSLMNRLKNRNEL